MATVTTGTASYTFEDFLAFAREDQKGDLLDGVIYLASPESTADNQLGGWLYRLMSEYADELDLGRLFFTRVAFRLGSRHGPEPDIAFVARENLRRVQQGFVHGPPDIAVEIVSADSVERDYVRKRRIYESAGVREYWIIDPAKRRVTSLRRQRGRFREVALTGTFLESFVMPGFSIDVRWLWTTRRPSVSRILRDLLKTH